MSYILNIICYILYIECYILDVKYKCGNSFPMLSTTAPTAHPGVSIICHIRTFLLFPIITSGTKHMESSFNIVNVKDDVNKSYII